MVKYKTKELFDDDMYKLMYKCCALALSIKIENKMYIAKNNIYQCYCNIILAIYKIINVGELSPRIVKISFYHLQEQYR